jgi:hypothetical protein
MVLVSNWISFIVNLLIPFPLSVKQGSTMKIYEVDPLTCPQCQGTMRVISIIEDQEVINKILLPLGLWQTKQRPPPKPKTLELQIDYSDSQHTFYEEAPDPVGEVLTELIQKYVDKP